MCGRVSRRARGGEGQRTASPHGTVGDLDRFRDSIRRQVDDRKRRGGSDSPPLLLLLLDYCFGAVVTDWSGAGSEVAFRRPNLSLRRMFSTCGTSSAPFSSFTRRCANA